jgi:acetolactate synthase-1/2/3 large subunit
MIVLCGQQVTWMLGKDAFQEADIFNITSPVVKHNFLVKQTNALPRIAREAYHIATTGRPGPVLIDIPKNIQIATAQPVFPKSVNLRGYNPDKKACAAALQELLGLLERAKRPMIYCGGGVISGEASAELLEFAERAQVPVATTLMGIGCFPETHALSLKWLGMHGTVYANNAVNEADLLLAIGVRFDDRVTGKVEKFCEHGTIVHIDIDNSEINKNKLVSLPILGDLKDALGRLNKSLEKSGRKRLAKGYALYPDWYRQIAKWKAESPLRYKDTPDAIQPQHVIRELYDLTKGDAIITTGVGQHQMWAGQFYDFTRPRTFLTSAGLGTMGFGYPAAIGAKVASPEKQVIDIDGDGSFLMNVQELATAHIEGIAAKAIILNNQHLGMVVQWEDRFHGGNRGHTFLGDPKDLKRIYPDYVQICKGFGVTCERVLHKKDLRAAIGRLLASKEVYVLDVMTPYTEHVLPMIPSGRTYKDIITE